MPLWGDGLIYISQPAVSRCDHQIVMEVAIHPAAATATTSSSDTSTIARRPARARLHDRAPPFVLADRRSTSPASGFRVGSSRPLS
jgi:hypothetical protein